MDLLAHPSPYGEDLCMKLCTGCKFDNLVHPAAPAGAQSLVARDNWFWEPGETIVVWFESGQRDWWLLVSRYAQDWRANLKLVYPQLGDEVPKDWVEKFPGRQCDIRIGFREFDPVTGEGGGSWAYFGRWHRYLAPDGITMNFGWFRDAYERMDYREIRRVVCHELGHALGWNHEHRNPLRGFDLSDLIFEELGAQGWSRERVLETYGAIENPETVHEYNELSVMNYYLPERFTSTGAGVPFNDSVSLLDIEQNNKVYGENPQHRKDTFAPIIFGGD